MENSKKPFYFVKDGKPACTIVHSENPFPWEIYSELTSPEASMDTPVKNLRFLARMAENIWKKTGAWPELKTVREAEEIEGPKAVFGRTVKDDLTLLGDATSKQFLLAKDGENLITLARTPGGYFDAIRVVADSLIFSEDGQDAYVPAEAFHLYDRELPPVRHAYDKFTVSFYGTPYFRAELEDETVFRDIVDFGTDLVPLFTGNWEDQMLDDENRVARMRALIERFYAAGVSVRLYGVDQGKARRRFQTTGEMDLVEENVKKIVERYGDLEGVAHWGFFDEPEPDDFDYCAQVKRLFNRYDPKKRPVYINLGPRAHCRGIQSFYDHFSSMVRPDFHCLDRYPFFMTERGAEVKEDYFYAHFERNRNAAIDDSVDSGMILAAIKVGADPARADINQDFMDWQTNLLVAYGCRYLEQYVYYYAHPYSILDVNNRPTFRWHIARKANMYLKKVMPELVDRELYSVFHLPRKDGAYDIDTVPYTGYRGLGEVSGVDAVLSFYEGGVLVVTDKRASVFDGGDHEVKLSGMKKNVRWFNPETEAWEEIASCPAAKAGEDGLRLTLSRATQYILCSGAENA